jgi:cell division septation protein DedD
MNRPTGKSPDIAGAGLRLVLPVAAILALAACEGGFPSPGGGTTTAGATATSVELVETDVEAPEIFQVTDAGLWDGRPSLGGVWVAHPDVTEPERVIIRNQNNGTFVIGALFRRERENPGPVIQVSSDAAEALQMLAGAPATLNVTALRREEPAAAPEPAPALAAALPSAGATEPLADADPLADPVAQPGPLPAAEPEPRSGNFFSRLFGGDPAPEPAPITDTASGLPQAEAIGVTPLDPVAGAAAAIEAAEAAGVPGTEASPAPLTSAPAPATGASDLTRPYIQLGIFSIESNANDLAQDLQSKGLATRVVAQESQGRSFWRVLVGPATSEAQRQTWLDQVKAEGFADAYFVAD